MTRLVLVVEDDALIRKGMVGLLRGDGHDAVGAASVTEATGQLQTVRPTHVLLDLNLPDGPGTDVLRLVRARSLPVRVALVTGASDTELTDEARALGVDALFVKPPDWDKLLAGRDAPGQHTPLGPDGVVTESVIPHVRIADFINANVEPILVEWEAFARSIWPPGTAVGPAELRDSAEEILRAAVADMATPQSAREQSEKSAGRGARSGHSDRLDHASEVHGAGRVGSGLSLPEVVAEYRALRASVLRLWRQSMPAPDAHDVDDITRFNEAIDQSLALAVQSYTRRLDTARNMFLGILGHDLRNPLAAITLTAKMASAGVDPSELPQQLSQIVASAGAISALITDLIDFARSAMGVGMPLAPARADLHVLCEEVVREARAAHPGRPVRIRVGGDLAGTWDPHRLRQLMSNLLANALQHGSAGEPVELAADGSAADAVVLTVHNAGDPIPADVLPTIFDPLVRGPGSVQHRRTPGSIGLGLYIVREIAAAHGGTADLTSTAATGTTATVRLPRHVVK